MGFVLVSLMMVATPAPANDLGAAFRPQPNSTLAVAAKLLDDGDAKGALASLEGYRGGGRALADHLRAQAHWALGDQSAAESIWEAMEFSTCRRAGPDPLQARVRVTRAKLLAAADPAAAAEQLLSLPANAPQLAEAIALLGQAKQDKKADEIVGRLLVRFPAEQETLAAARQLGPAAVQAHLATIEQRMQRLRRLTGANANRAAADEADALLKDLPDDHAFRCELLYLQGRTARKRRRYQQALTVLRRARNACLKERNFLMRSVLLTVQVQAIRGHLRGMRRNVEWMAKYHPKHRFTDDARFLYADALDRRNRKTAAAKQYDIVARMPNSDQAVTAAWRLAWRSIRRKRTTEAKQRLKSILERPVQREIEHQRARYWLARIEERRAPSRAVRNYKKLLERPSFYAWMALERLRDVRPRTAKAVEAQLVQIATATTTPPIPSSVLNATDFEAAKAYAAAGDTELAAWSLNRLTCSNPGPKAIVAIALALGAVGESAASQNQIRRRPSLLAKPLSASTIARWRAAYSRPYADELTGAANAAKIDPFLLTALVREESTFDPEVVSWAGATGLAQLMRATAKSAHVQVFKKPLDPSQLTDPSLNLRLGAHVLAQAIRSFGEPVLALGAYNGGHGLVRRALKRRAQPFEQWIEEFGVKETRQYMKRVTRTWGVYRLLYDADRPFIRLPKSVSRRR